MLLELPVTEALALATAEQPLPPVVRSVRPVGDALHVEVDLAQVPGAALTLLQHDDGVPALVRLFSAFTGDEEVLSSGLPGSATIVSLEPTGWQNWPRS